MMQRIMFLNTRMQINSGPPVTNLVSELSVGSMQKVQVCLTIIICRTSIICSAARRDGREDFFVEQYNDTVVYASKSTLRREHALGARGHGVGHLVMIPTYGGKALGSRAIVKIYLYKYTVSCNLMYSALYVNTLAGLATRTHG